jgi:CNT family concentrative nucleoside transporter
MDPGLETDPESSPQISVFIRVRPWFNESSSSSFGRSRMQRFTGLIGLIVIPSVVYLLSSNRKAIRWKTVAWGFGLQITFAFLVLKWAPGVQLFQKLGGVINKLLSYSEYGSNFLFGPLGSRAAMIKFLESVVGHPLAANDPLLNYVSIFALQVLPTIIFVAALFAILYYLGVMQLIVRAFAVVMTYVLGASGAESLNVAASIFMGQTEAPLTIRPFLAEMTESELFCVMTSGMAHISGGIMAAYIAFGAKAEHLLTAVIMTAPGTIMMAKMLVPETGSPKTAGKVHLKIDKTDVNIVDAASRGTGEGLNLALNVAAMLISFIAIIFLLNGLLGLIPFLGEPLSMQRIFGWVFSPVAWMMGVPWKDAGQVGNLLGTRLVLNEFIAYSGLGVIKDTIDPRSFTIATFALCGFANFSSIGIQIGGIGALAPNRRHDLARLGFRAVLAGTLANFLTACIAGILI